MKSFVISAALSAFLSTLSGTFASSQHPTVTIDTGEIVGTSTSVPGSETGINKFLGIPFGYADRFSVPEKAQPWSGPLNTTAFKPACIQRFACKTTETFNIPAPEESEDCLYINVLIPESRGKNRTVMVWLYGGGLQFGHGGFHMYDGSALAAHEDVVYVSFNYRTNVFGFPNSSELPLESRNLGFLDQRLALDWVQRNIYAFGGDSSKVTIFGESAGSFSVDALLTSFPKDSSPPFRAAIMQSGEISYGGYPDPRELWPDTTSVWETLADTLNCTGSQSSLDCLKKMPAASIREVIEQQSLFFNPTYDNITLNPNAARDRAQSKIASIPILSGTDAQEGRFIILGQNNVSAYLDDLLVGQPDQVRKAIEAAYPVGGWEFPSDFDAIAQMETEVLVHCGAALVANDTATSGTQSWRYYFNASFPNTQQFPGEGVYHSSEIPIIYGTYPAVCDPYAGPGWNAIGTGTTFYGGEEDYDLDVGMLGANGGAGVEILRQRDVDARCGLWAPVLRKRF
ncbi:alpha/beta-hydrolase [Pleomassaria siparia CBS 279.74]|uniref:Carboxylic ester hydrolase n=1 Tax=Pleomassaria siparia CBS 279.74 TaxID=1314801 RepID=A0A6G1KB97_9PLEO|nr:alpha/beta-hydrolase [Pleomassaria siparia CBS 279.74]